MGGWSPSGWRNRSIGLGEALRIGLFYDPFTTPSIHGRYHSWLKSMGGLHQLTKILSWDRRYLTTPPNLHQGSDPCDTVSKPVKIKGDRKTNEDLKEICRDIIFHGKSKGSPTLLPLKFPSGHADKKTLSSFFFRTLSPLIGPEAKN